MNIPYLKTSFHAIHGGFLKWWYPTTIGFPTKNDQRLGCFGETTTKGNTHIICSCFSLTELTLYEGIFFHGLHQSPPGCIIKAGHLGSHWMDFFKSIPSSKLTWQWKIPLFSREYIFNRSIFHCHVLLPEGTWPAITNRESRIPACLVVWGSHIS